MTSLLMSNSSPCKACSHPRPEKSPQTCMNVAFDDLVRSSAYCSPCDVLVRGIQAVVGDTSLLEHVRLDFNMSTFYKGLDVFIFQSKISISVFTVPDSPHIQQLMPDVPIGYPIPPSTESKAALVWIKQQLNACNSSHTCLQQTNQHNVPSRLLHTKDDIRLVHPDTSVKYICLSYCWGAHLPLRTVKSNIQQHTQSIPLSSLPLTFQQAIQFCRDLGIHYIWIDSLCIVQDDEKDWNKEAAKMADIYQSAYLVISASSSTNSLGGLYSTPNIDIDMKPIPVRNSNEQVYFRKSLLHASNFLDRRLGNAESFPTLTRAWILQERLLPARVLHFGPHEVYWECLQQSKCQCRESFSHQGARSEIQHVSRLKSYFSAETWKTQSPDELVATWHRLVTDYSRLHMTHAKDAFPAISGIAKRFHEVKNCQYIAGLWRTSFIQDLLWYANTSDAESWARPSETWLAPSWSWVSVQGPIEYVANIQGLRAFCTLQEHSIALATENETGQLLNGHIILTGYAFDTVIEHVDDPDTAVPWRTFRVTALRDKVASAWADYNCLVLGPRHLPSGTKVTCLLVGESNISNALYILILISQGDKYKRVGMAQISKPPNKPSGLQYWLGTLDVPPHKRLINII